MLPLPHQRGLKPITGLIGLMLGYRFSRLACWRGASDAIRNSKDAAEARYSLKKENPVFGHWPRMFHDLQQIH